MKKEKLPLSIVIPCADDIRIKHCIESIDVDAEILVVLNGATLQVKNIVKTYSVRQIMIKERNLANALNIGIEKARNKKVILIDSDCVFDKGAIKKVYKALDDHLVVKGKVVFRSNDLFSQIIAQTRDYVYSNPPKPYNPFLGMRKETKKRLGGYYFDKDIYWTEDADLNSRLVNAGIAVKYVFSAKAYHPPLAVKHDLRSAFRYGIGKRIRVEKKISSGVGTHFRKVVKIGIKKGVSTGIYYFLWNSTFLTGYFYQILRDPYGARSRLIK